MYRRRLMGTCAAAALTVAFAANAPVPEALAQSDASELAALESQADTLVGTIEQATDAYTQATSRVEELADAMERNRAHLADIESQLPEQRERTASSVKSMYLLQQSQPSLLELMLGSEDFNDFITTVRYLGAIHDHNTSQIHALCEMQDDLTRTQANLDVELEAALAQQRDALRALEDVRAARAELEERAQAIRDAAQAAEREERERAEQAAQEAEQAAAAAIETLPEAAAQATVPPAHLTSEDPAPHIEPVSDPPETPGDAAAQPGTQADAAGASTLQIQAPSQIQSASPEDTSSWAARIDAYLEGSPLEGYGQVFADAAAAYGVDPRISPAISCVESSKGAVCFASHNAWGWGSSGWGSWEEAIYAHVSGFASIYGSSVDLADAKMYAGDDIYLTWYGLVQSEMASI